MKSQSPCRNRSIAVVLILGLGFTAVSMRLVQIQVMDHEHYRSIAMDRQYDRYPVPARRGSILDSSGRVLAQSISVADVRIDGKLAVEKPELIDRLAPLLGMTPVQLHAQVEPKKRYKLLRRGISEVERARLFDFKRKHRMQALILEERMERVYPNRLEAAHLIGLVNKVEINSGISSTKILEQQGVEGAELVMDEVLRGLPGERRVVRDGSRRRDEIAAYRQLHREPRHGYNVLLTIDQRVQHIVEQEADRLIKDFSPEGLQIVVVRPKTGAILALTNRPTFDPSDRKTVNKTSLRNRSLTDVFEPGSTFKIVTLTAALNERIADLNTEIFCEYGRFFYGGHWLRDTHPHGNLKVRETFAVSSNIAFAKLAMVLGERKLYNYIRKFGFGRKAQISTLALPGEEGGILRRPALWNKISITRIPMGHEIAVTTLQMTMAMAAIANDGMLMTPQVVSKITDQHGKVRRHFPPQPAGRVCDPEVAKLVRRAAMEVIFTEKGTGGRARLKSFTAGGKTGTANKIKNGQYSTEFYTSSFVGFVPMEKPEFVITVVVDSPQGSKRSGGYVAAPAFRNIARLIAEELNLSPSQPDYRYVLGGNS